MNNRSLQSRITALLKTDFSSAFLQEALVVLELAVQRLDSLEKAGKAAGLTPSMADQPVGTIVPLSGLGTYLKINMEAKRADGSEFINILDGVRAEERATVMAETAGQWTAFREAAATHSCKICDARWILHERGWSLASKNCGACCDVGEMGDQMQPIGLTKLVHDLQDENAHLERSLTATTARVKELNSRLKTAEEVLRRRVAPPIALVHGTRDLHIASAVEAGGDVVVQYGQPMCEAKVMTAQELQDLLRRFIDSVSMPSTNSEDPKC